MTEGLKGEGPDDRMFIGNPVLSVDRGVTSDRLLFIARRPDSPYLVPGIDIPYRREDTVVSKAVAQKMAAAIRLLRDAPEGELNDHELERKRQAEDAAHAALAEYAGETL